jgi:predicted glycosyltransferase
MARVLIYSHDSFGLGHVRRCLAIAGAIADAFVEARVLILTGSPLIARFDLPDRVDYVSVPGIVKQRDGGYVSRDPAEPFAETIRLRAEIIRRTAEAFAPDLFLVDKEPLGLRGEVAETLHLLKSRGARLVLGLRDILDAPEALAAEWRRKGAMAALEALYDEIWVFGLREVWDPLTEIDVSPRTRAKMRFTGYLDRRRAKAKAASSRAERLLITPGGGGDGVALVDWTLAAYEQAGEGLPGATILLGPFMPRAEQAAFRARADRLGGVETKVFSSHAERLFATAGGVVAMGGYNTFAEILSHDLPMLLVPRETPRAEQRIRAERAVELGLARALYDDGARDPGLMAAAIRALDAQARPSQAAIPGLLDGLPETCRLAAPWLVPAEHRARAFA